MRVLFTSVPGVGHLHPMLPLAKAIISDGGEVRWVTGADGCARLRRAGIDAAEAGFGEAEGIASFRSRFPEAAELAPQDVPDFMFPKLFGAVRAPSMVTGLEHIAREWRPELMVCDAAELAGPIVANQLGVPNVTHSFGALLPAKRVAAAAAEVASLWRERNLEPRPYCGCYDHLYLDIYPPSLQTGDAAHVGAVQLVRPEGLATAGEAVPAWVATDADVPLLYLTLGTVFTTDAVLSNVLTGISELGVRVVVTVGPRGDPDALGPQPPNVHVARYIAQQELLPHCAGVVSHAGSGTFLAALAAGLPQVCLPQAADQFLNAAAADAAGCGVAILPAAFSPDAVRAAVRRILEEDAIRAAAQKLSDEIAAMPRATEVAEQLSSLVP